MMADTLSTQDRAALLNSVEKARPIKAKLDLSKAENASALIRLAIQRSGLSQKAVMFEMGYDDTGRFSRLLDGKEKLWFHTLVQKLPPEVWRELLIVLACEVCKGAFRVKRSVTIEEVSA